MHIPTVAESPREVFIVTCVFIHKASVRFESARARAHALDYKTGSSAFPFNGYINVSSSARTYVDERERDVSMFVHTRSECTDGDSRPM